MDTQAPSQTTDTIPRASLESVVLGLDRIAASSGKVELDEVRRTLQAWAQDRSGPLLRNDMLSTTRDVLADLRRLRLIEIEGPLPRPAQKEQKPCLCVITESGAELAKQFAQDSGRGYDALFSLWYQDHPYFASMVRRLQLRPFYLPEFTGIKHLGVALLRERDAQKFAEGIAEKTGQKLPDGFFETIDQEHLKKEIISRANDLHQKTSLESVSDLQLVVDKIQDTVVAPAVIACERLGFDRVTLKHILKACRDFIISSSTTRLPECDSRAYFITCHLQPGADSKVRIVHHGVTFAEQQFHGMMKRCYRHLSRDSGTWVNAYALRAKVCIEMGIQQEVFNRCFRTYVEKNVGNVATELSFRSSHFGETPIDVKGKEISLIQLNY
jgi:hypothetical protein